MTVVTVMFLCSNQCNDNPPDLSEYLTNKIIRGLQPSNELVQKVSKRIS